MKKKTILLAVCLLALCGTVFALAAGGDASDPLASLSHLNGPFASMAERKIEDRLDASDKALLESSGSDAGASGQEIASVWQELRMKAGDAVSGTTGTMLLPLAGSVRADISSGTVVDVTTGSAVPSGTVLTANHRYLAAEDTLVMFTVASRTAVLNYQGPYALTYSGAIDYNAMASALKLQHLFKGSFTGYGQGFDLELAPTRVQALIMFIRILGEEDAALAYTGSTPFKDIGKGSLSEKYVGYALEKGYTNGYTPTLFKPTQPVTANQYMEFMLRALGYSSVSNTDLSGTMDKAVQNGVITSGEKAMLQQSEPFLRADLVYISYYALDAEVAGTGLTLRDVLLTKGVFTGAESAEAISMVDSRRP